MRDFVHIDGPVPATSQRNPLRVRREWATVVPNSTGIVWICGTEAMAPLGDLVSAGTKREEPMSELDYYSEAAHGPHEIFELGNYQLESGITLASARIAYKTHGTLNAAKDNLVLVWHTEGYGDFYRRGPLDPRKYFIILPASSPTVFHLRPATHRRCSTAVPSRTSQSVTMSWHSTG
jgi:hypothetical protein